MHIKKLRVLNYKGFRDSGFLEFGPGFNVIVGQNNSGKTALLESLGLHFGENKPNKRPDTPAEYPLDGLSLFEFDLEVTGSDLIDATLRATGPTMREELSRTQRFAPEESVSDGTRTCLEMKTNRGGAWTSRDSDKTFPALWLMARGGLIEVEAVGQRQDVFQVFGDSGRRDLVNLSWQGFSSLFYGFKAERLNISKSPMNASEILRPNAENLPEVLAVMFSKNEKKKNEYNTSVASVLQAIQFIQSRPIGGNQNEIFVWNRGIDLDRSDLANSLGDCGAGVGQVLAILYVAMTMPPSVIMIDEPNSFLHPGAAKKLMQVLKNYKHQYFIATHSTDLVSAIEPDTLHLVQWSDGESRVTALDRSELEDMRLVLSEVGLGLSDVFASDRVIWVEGRTEEICFPKLLQASGMRMPIGLSFLGLANTGDFEAKGRKADEVLGLYEKLGGANGIMPVSSAIHLDRETRTDTEISDMRRKYFEKLHILPRRCYENYLLHPGAIAAALTGLVESGLSVTMDQVQDWISKEGAGCHPEKLSPNDTDWLLSVDAPKLLKRLFSDLSGATVAFSKTRHSVALTDWLLGNHPEHLDELMTYVVGLVKATE